MEYRKAIGSIKLVAIVDDSFDFVHCQYKIYMDKKLKHIAKNYIDLIIFTNSIGYDVIDINEAITTMKQKSHDTAQFGVFGSLLFTEDSLEDGEGIAS